MLEPVHRLPVYRERIAGDQKILSFIIPPASQGYEMTVKLSIIDPRQPVDVGVEVECSLEPNETPEDGDSARTEHGSKESEEAAGDETHELDGNEANDGPNGNEDDDEVDGNEGDNDELDDNEGDDEELDDDEDDEDEESPAGKQHCGSPELISLSSSHS